MTSIDSSRASRCARRPTPYPERVLKLIRRRPTAASLLAVACLAVVISLLVGLRAHLISRGRMADEDKRVAALRSETERVLSPDSP